MLMSQVAAAINFYIQKKMHTSFEDSEEMFMDLRNQKCIVCAIRIVTNENQSATIQYYNKFKINILHPLICLEINSSLTTA